MGPTRSIATILKGPDCPLSYHTYGASGGYNGNGGFGGFDGSGTFGGGYSSFGESYGGALAGCDGIVADKKIR